MPMYKPINNIIFRPKNKCLEGEDGVSGAGNVLCGNGNGSEPIER